VDGDQSSINYRLRVQLGIVWLLLCYANAMT